MTNQQVSNLSTAKGVMEAFHISRPTLEKWMRLGMPVYRAVSGRNAKLYFDIGEVEAWIRRDTIDAIKGK